MESTDTLRIVQGYAKECLDVFVNKEFSDADILFLPMLTFISDLCSKRVCYQYHQLKRSVDPSAACFDSTAERSLDLGLSFKTPYRFEEGTRFKNR
jgi:hypothetical protein